MENKSKLAKLYTKLTGITADLDKLIESTPEEEKASLFKKIAWQIHRGEIIENEGDIKESFNEFIPELAETLGIENVEDADKDGDVDEEDEKIRKDLEKTSTIKVETDDSTESEDEEGIDIEP